MKVVSSLKKRCMYCQIVKRKGRLYVTCKKILDIKLDKDNFYISSYWKVCLE